MRIAVIGGGVSGMTAAWLLQHDHHVTLFERAPRLGGHVETVPVTLGGKTIHAELGPRFFFDSAYPYFLALLRLLSVPIRWSGATVSFTDIGREHTIVLPPRSPRQLASLLASPRVARHVLSLRRLIDDQAGVARGRDFSVTFRDHLARRRYPATFGPEFAYPFLAACWGAPLWQLPDFPVYSLLKGMPPGKRAGFYEILGGMSRYVRAFADELSHVDVRLGVGVERVEGNGPFLIDTTRGEVRRFDQLIVATSSREAATLLARIPVARELAVAASAFRHFDTEIVLHGDVSLMPGDRRDWSHTNLFRQGSLAWMSDWQGRSDDAPVFRTWLPKGRAAPRPVYGHRVFHHLVMTPENAAHQRRIAALQGREGVWLTGMYAVDIDNHESALLSALVPAKALAPHAANLRRLLSAVVPDAPHGLEVLPAPAPAAVALGAC